MLDGIALAAGHEAHGADPVSLRDRAMMELLYSTGLRRKEAGSLTRSSIDFERLVVFVREGKGGRDRVVPLGARAAAWLEKYLYEARPQLTLHDATALFVTDFGDPASGAYVAMRVKRNGAGRNFQRVREDGRVNELRRRGGAIGAVGQYAG